jgi:hypothetical protein
VTRLRDRSADLSALVSQTVDATQIPAAFVEKDFWVVELLRSVSASVEGAVVVFKGGTSLSKAYGLVERFSEDVDLLLAVGGELSIGQRDHLLKLICKRVEQDLGVTAGPPFSKRGVFRNVRYPYPSVHRDARVTEGVLLEMGIRGNPDPHREMLLRSYVADHGLTRLGLDEAEYEEFRPVAANVLNPERTLVEKLSIVHHLETLEPETIRTSEKGRHLYDIHQLLGDAETLAAIGDGYVHVAAADSERHSAANGWDYTPRPADGFAASAAFDQTGPKAEALRAGYERVRPLVYGAFPSFDAVLEKVRSHARLL